MVPKGVRFGSQNGIKIDAKSKSKSRAKKLPLGSDLGRFWVVSGGVWGTKNADFSLGFQIFCKIHVFALDGRPRVILERFRCQKGPKRHPKRLPKRAKRAPTNDINISFDLGTISEPIWLQKIQVISGPAAEAWPSKVLYLR